MDKIISTQTQKVTDASGFLYEFTSQLIKRDGKMILETSIKPLFDFDTVILHDGKLISFRRNN